MNVYIEHDAATLAQLAGESQPHCDGLIVKHGRMNEVLAATIRQNPLGESWLLDLDVPSQRVLTWSGTLATKLFEPHPQTWMKPGQTALATFCKEIAPQLQRHNWRLCFHPHSRHVLNDAQSCLNFLNKHQGEPFEIALAPASLLEPSMLLSIEDHLTRMFQMLGPRCAMVMLHDVRLVEENDQPHCEAVALGDGVLPRDVVLQLMGELVPKEVPVVVSAEKISQQLEWLGK